MRTARSDERSSLKRKCIRDICVRASCSVLVCGCFVFPTRSAAQARDAGVTTDSAAVATVADAAPRPSLLPPQLVYAAPPDDPRQDDPADTLSEAERGDVTVCLDLLIDASGDLLDAHVVSREPEAVRPQFDGAAVAAARASRFHAATRDGAPIRSTIHYNVVFHAPHEGMHARSPRSNATTVVTPSTGGDDPDPEPDPAPTTSPLTVQPTRSAAPASNERHGARARVAAAPRAAGQFPIAIGALSDVPRQNASSLLLLAPGIMLTNEGGDGHAERVYLRGFDAREGQDIEFLADGVPFNDVGNPHGEGYADTHWIIPELVRELHVMEGPFDPQQGNYAVAGSAEYRLGAPRPGITASYQIGSFNTHRFTLIYGTGTRDQDPRLQSFGAADIRTSDGFGTNRAAEHARAIGRFSVDLGNDTVLTLLGTAYATRFGSAGVVREDAYTSGRVGFYDAMDNGQGGDATRMQISAAIDGRDGALARFNQLLFVSVRGMRNRANFTGFLEDPPAAFRTGLTQRGDMVDQTYGATTVGARGSYRRKFSIFSSAAEGTEDSAVEVGYFGRHDSLQSAARRLRAGTVIPYRVDFDHLQSVTNLALYGDLSLRPWSWLTIQGGARVDLMHFDVNDQCALHDTAISGGMLVIDEICYTRDRIGMRDPTTRRTASGILPQPRVSAIIGPFESVSIATSFGMGARATDPSALSDGERGPFAQVTAFESGAIFDREIGDVRINARALYYYTRVGRDLVFNQQEGRNTLAPGTERQGALVALRATNPWLDVSASLTFANARFQRSATDAPETLFTRDAGDTVPFVPPWVGRIDAAIHGTPIRIWDHPVELRAALGFSFISARPLLYGQTGENIAVTDASVSARYRWAELSLSVQNVFDQRYRLGEYNFASEFDRNAPAPNLLAVRHFTAGPPFGAFLTLTVATDEPTGTTGAEE